MNEVIERASRYASQVEAITLGIPVWLKRHDLML
jgi:hypothetical protein